MDQSTPHQMNSELDVLDTFMDDEDNADVDDNDSMYEPSSDEDTSFDINFEEVTGYKFSLYSF